MTISLTEDRVREIAIQEIRSAFMLFAGRRDSSDDAVYSAARQTAEDLEARLWARALPLPEPQDRDEEGGPGHAATAQARDLRAEPSCPRCGVTASEITARNPCVCDCVCESAPALNALQEIMDYRGGAESALHDEYVMERVAAAITAGEAATAQARDLRAEGYRAGTEAAARACDLRRDAAHRSRNTALAEEEREDAVYYEGAARTAGSCANDIRALAPPETDDHRRRPVVLDEFETPD